MNEFIKEFEGVSFSKIWDKDGKEINEKDLPAFTSENWTPVSFEIHEIRPPWFFKIRLKGLLLKWYLKFKIKSLIDKTN